eukprot:g402.t1
MPSLKDRTLPLNYSKEECFSYYVKTDARLGWEVLSRGLSEKRLAPLPLCDAGIKTDIQGLSTDSPVESESGNDTSTSVSVLSPVPVTLKKYEEAEISPANNVCKKKVDDSVKNIGEEKNMVRKRLFGVLYEMLALRVAGLDAQQFFKGDSTDYYTLGIIKDHVNRGTYDDDVEAFIYDCRTVIGHYHAKYPAKTAQRSLVRAVTRVFDTKVPVLVGPRCSPRNISEGYRGVDVKEKKTVSVPTFRLARDCEISMDDDDDGDDGTPPHVLGRKGDLEEEVIFVRPKHFIQSIVLQYAKRDVEAHEVLKAERQIFRKPTFSFTTAEPLRKKEKKTASSSSSVEPRLVKKTENAKKPKLFLRLTVPKKVLKKKDKKKKKKKSIQKKKIATDVQLKMKKLKSPSSNKKRKRSKSMETETVEYSRKKTTNPKRAFAKEALIRAHACTLTMFDKAFYDYECDVCNAVCKGITYHCLKCDFDACPSCAKGS